MMCTNPTYENVTPEFSSGTCSYDACTDSPSQFLRLQDRDSITSSQLQSATPCSREHKSPSFSPMLRDRGSSLPLSPSPNTDTQSPAHQKRPPCFNMTCHPLQSKHGSSVTPAALSSAHECLKIAIQRRLQYSSPLSPAPSYPPAEPDPACPTLPLDMSHLMPPGPRLTQGALKQAHSFPPTTHGAPKGLAEPALPPEGTIQAHAQGLLLERFLQAGTPSQACQANSSELHTAKVPSSSPGLGINGSPLPFVTPPGPFQFLFPINNPESPGHALSGVSETSSWDLASHNAESHVVHLAASGPRFPGSDAVPFVHSIGPFVPGSPSVSPQDAIAAAAAGMRRDAERSALKGNSLASVTPPPSPGWTARTSELSWTLSMTSQAGSIHMSDRSSLQPAAPLFSELEAVAAGAPKDSELTPLRCRYAVVEAWPSEDAIVDVRYDREVAVQRVPLRRRYGADWTRRCDNSDGEEREEDQVSPLSEDALAVHNTFATVHDSPVSNWRVATPTPSSRATSVVESITGPGGSRARPPPKCDHDILLTPLRRGRAGVNLQTPTTALSIIVGTGYLVTPGSNHSSPLTRQLQPSPAKARRRVLVATGGLIDGSGAMYDSVVATGVLASPSTQGSAPQDTPDRALIGVVSNNTPDQSPSLTLPTCSFATSTADDTVFAHPSPMVTSPTDVATMMPSPRSTWATTLETLSPQPLKPSASLTPIQHADRPTTVRAVPHSAAAALRQSAADVRFCTWDQMLPGSRAPVATVPEHAPSISELETPGTVTTACGVDTPLYDAGDSPSSREQTPEHRTRHRWPEAALQSGGALSALSVCGSFCSAYKETWHEAMASYAAAKREFPASAASPATRVQTQHHLRFQASDLTFNELQASAGAPIAVLPSPAMSALGYARTLPPNSPCDTTDGQSVSAAGMLTGRSPPCIQSPATSRLGHARPLPSPTTSALGHARTLGLNSPSVGAGRYCAAGNVAPRPSSHSATSASACSGSWGVQTPNTLDACTPECVQSGSQDSAGGASVSRLRLATGSDVVSGGSKRGSRVRRWRSSLASKVGALFARGRTSAPDRQALVEKGCGMGPGR